MPDKTIAGVILAGGRARRLGGRDKNHLVIRDDHDDRPGRSIIVRQVDLLQRVAARVYVATTPADHAAQPDRFSGLPVVVVTDAVDGAGPLAGLHAALRATTAGRLLVLAGDLPFLSPALLEALADVPSWADGQWVVTPRGPEPLVACYRRRIADRLGRLLRDGERRAASLGAGLAMAALDEDALARLGDPARLLTNINTPDDLRRVQ